MIPSSFLTSQRVQSRLLHAALPPRLNFWTDAFRSAHAWRGPCVNGNTPAVWWMDARGQYSTKPGGSHGVPLLVSSLPYFRVTVGEVVCCRCLHILYTLLWFSTWGGVGLRRWAGADELMALELEILQRHLLICRAGQRFLLRCSAG
jgi:hypothetical protein